MKKVIGSATLVGLVLLSATAMANIGKDKYYKSDEYFREADANNDGFISKQEMQNEYNQKVDEMFRDMDTNRDSRLSKDELQKDTKGDRKWMRDDMKNRDRDMDGTRNPQYDGRR